MALSEIIKLGDPLLLKKSASVEINEIPGLLPHIEKMWRLIREFREAYGRGRAIAAPQTGLLKRVICLNIEKTPVLINPVIEEASDEMIDIWDDCMSFPDLSVRVKRHRRITVSFLDIEGQKKTWHLEDDMSELIQHEYDHLNGILAISRAEDIMCFKWLV